MATLSEVEERQRAGDWSAKCDEPCCVIDKSGEPSQETSQTGWLIEGNGVYWDGHHADARGFTSDVNKAVRFARQEDADVVRCWLLEPFAFALRTTEHCWLDNSSQEREEKL